MNYFLPLETGNLDGLLILVLLVMFGPALVFVCIGFILRSQKHKKVAKIFFILAGVYLLISLGVCGGFMGGF